MKKQAKDIKKGDFVMIGGKKCSIDSFEMSDVGKQGKRKCRIEVKTPEGEKIVLIRPEDYPMDVVT
jgi:translation elongation factor P/translation initiation factor 5A